MTIYLFIKYLSVWIHGFLFYVMGYSLLLPLCILMSKLSHICPVRSPSGWFQSILTCVPWRNAWAFSCSGTRWCSRLILYFPCSNPGISHFCSEPLFFLVENSIQKSGSGWLVCLLLLLLVVVAGALLLDTLSGYMHIYLYIYLYNIFKDIEKSWIPIKSNSKLTPQDLF